MRYIAAEEDVRSVGLAGYQFSELPFGASRTDDHEARLRVSIANGTERLHLERKVVFGLEEADRKENWVVRLEEALERFGHVPGRELGGQRMRLNEPHIPRFHSESMEEPHDLRIDADDAIEPSKNEAGK